MFRIEVEYDGQANNQCRGWIVLKAKQAYRDLESIFRAGVDRVNPGELIRAGLHLKGEQLTVRSESASFTIDLAEFERIVVLGAGKASAALAAAALPAPRTTLRTTCATSMLT